MFVLFSLNLSIPDRCSNEMIFLFILQHFLLLNDVYCLCDIKDRTHLLIRLSYSYLLFSLPNKHDNYGILKHYRTDNKHGSAGTNNLIHK